MPYLRIDDHDVYHEVAGAGEPLVLLHGGFCSIEAMRDLGDLLARHFEVHSVERTGHGRTPDRPEPFQHTYAGMADETVAYLDAVGVDAAHLVGFSDGAVAAMLVARDHPERVLSLIAISGNLSTDAYQADDYPHDTMTREALDQIEDEYKALSPDGPEHWEVFQTRLFALWAVEPDIPASSLSAITAPTLVMGGEHDVIRHDHLETVTASIEGAEFAVVPGTTHMLARERPTEVGARILEFLAPR